jgi:hypothetical protein
LLEVLRINSQITLVFSIILSSWFTYLSHRYVRAPVLTETWRFRCTSQLLISH